MDEKNYNIIERIVDKLFSGSFSVLIMVGVTYCVVVMCCVYLTLKGRLDPKDFLLIVGGLSTVLMALWKDYMALKKEDGPKINGENKKEIEYNSGTIKSEVKDV